MADGGTAGDAPSASGGSRVRGRLRGRGAKVGEQGHAMCVTLGLRLLRGRLPVAWWRERGEDDDAIAGRLIEGARLSACPDAAACDA